jgi:hypothetical protein
MNKNIACCLPIKNVESFLPKIFENLNLLSTLFISENFNVIFVHDNCTDDSEQLLNTYKNTSKFNVFIIDIDNDSPYRTVRIAKARNTCLDIVYNVLKNIDYHFMIDSDDVNTLTWNIDLIKYYLNNDNWDGLSFNRSNYYDIWALLYGDFKHHCWGFYYESHIVVPYIQKDIISKLNSLEKYELFECLSAFNGFAIYRTDKFIDIIYDGFLDNVKKYINDDEREQTLHYLRTTFNIQNLYIENNIDCCEHIHYHVSAIKKNNCRIRISKENLFIEQV